MRPSVRWYSVAAAAFLVLGIATALLFTRPLRAARPKAVARAAEANAAEALVQRGRYLVNAIACTDCHTPLTMGPNGPEPDAQRLLSGHPQDFVDTYEVRIPETPGFWMWAPTNTAFVGGWGTSYAINLTPDENTGIGIWTEDIFVNTLRTGKHWGTSRPILPPMPWQAFSTLSDEDLRAIYAYLRTIPPIHNRVPDAIVAGG